ncbi:hypothetical protein KKF81_01990 [Candidatus Micrarchaeota archaeon]|nr:hypothetical protein [Candidatus Micrarchaeota archaeon]
MNGDIDITDLAKRIANTDPVVYENALRELLAHLQEHRLSIEQRRELHTALMVIYKRVQYEEETLEDEAKGIYRHVTYLLEAHLADKKEVRTEHDNSEIEIETVLTSQVPFEIKRMIALGELNRLYRQILDEGCGPQNKDVYDKLNRISTILASLEAKEGSDIIHIGKAYSDLFIIALSPDINETDTAMERLYHKAVEMRERRYNLNAKEEQFLYLLKTTLSEKLECTDKLVRLNGLHLTKIANDIVATLTDGIGTLDVDGIKKRLDNTQVIAMLTNTINSIEKAARILGLFHDEISLKALDRTVQMMDEIMEKLEDHDHLWDEQLQGIMVKYHNPMLKLKKVVKQGLVAALQKAEKRQEKKQEEIKIAVLILGSEHERMIEKKMAAAYYILEKAEPHNKPTIAGAAKELATYKRPTISDVVDEREIGMTLAMLEFRIESALFHGILMSTNDDKIEIIKRLTKNEWSGSERVLKMLLKYSALFEVLIFEQRPFGATHFDVMNALKNALEEKRIAIPSDHTATFFRKITIANGRGAALRTHPPTLRQQ